MRISDWSSDVCSSDLLLQRQGFLIGRDRDEAVERRIQFGAIVTNQILRNALPAPGVFDAFAGRVHGHAKHDPHRDVDGVPPPALGGGLHRKSGSEQIGRGWGRERVWPYV